MGRSFYGFLFAGAFINTLAVSVVSYAADTKDEAIKKDHKLIEGVWTIVALEVNGNRAAESDIKKLTVVNGTDGTWSLNSEGKEISQGTSTIDPTTKLRTIDLMPTTGDDKGKQYLGIYELGEQTRKLCFAPPGKARPTEFSSLNGSENILVTFERDKVDSVQRDRKRIEGSWVVAALEVNGNKSMGDDTRKLKIVFGADGSWSLAVEGRDVAQGTSTIEPIKNPKAIDFTTTVGEDSGKQSFGIYEVGERSMTVCVGPPGHWTPWRVRVYAG